MFIDVFQSVLQKHILHVRASAECICFDSFHIFWNAYLNKTRVLEAAFSYFCCPFWENYMLQLRATSKCIFFYFGELTAIIKCNCFQAAVLKCSFVNRFDFSLYYYLCYSTVFETTLLKRFHCFRKYNLL